MKELSLIQAMLMADALIEYAVKHVLDDALFSRSVEVLRAIEYTTTADALQRYREAVAYDVCLATSPENERCVLELGHEGSHVPTQGRGWTWG